MPRVAKRKSTVKDEDFENVDPVEEKVSAAKKRKTTKGAKAGENMKLAERTVVSSLKKAMYIGAHVSAAGGLSHLSLLLSSIRRHLDVRLDIRSVHLHNWN